MIFTNPRDRYLSDDFCVYRDSDLQRIPLPSLRENIDVDVCIIGAGFMGLSTAFYLRQSGLNVAVIERHRVGWGASGRNAGFMLPGFNKDIRYVAKKFGMNNALKAYQGTMEALQSIKDVIKDNNIECHFKPGMTIAAITNKSAEDLKEYSAFISDNCGHKTRLMDKAETTDYLGTSWYDCCTEDSVASHFNPYRYLCGMADLLVGHGVKIYEETPAVELDAKSAIKRINTPNSVITAKRVVLAGDAYQGWLVPELRKQYVLMRASMLATEPLPSNLADTILKKTPAVYEWRYLLNYFAKTKDNRIIFGGADSPLSNTEANKQKAFNKIRKSLVEIYPAMENTHITHWWSGYLSVSMRELPNIGTVAPNVFYANGFSGHGVVPTHLAGMAIAGAIIGKSDMYNTLNLFQSSSIPGAGSHDQTLAHLGLLWYKLKEKFA